MEEEYKDQLDIDLQKIKNAIRLQIPIEITSYTLPRNVEVYIRNILEMFLKECQQSHLYEYLNFCLGELLTNSKKANTKRVYFKEKNLDINDPDDYEVGMLTFKEDTLTDIDRYLEMQKKAGLYIKLRLQLKSEQIIIEIINNAKLTVFEQERINKKLNHAQQYESMDDVVANVLDQSEGAGLGIIIIISMLTKIGLSKQNYKVISTDNETITKIILPCNQAIFAGNEILTYEFVKMQETVPVHKDSLTQIQQLLTSENNPDNASEPSIDRQQVLDLIKNDISLTLLLLKNSVQINPKTLSLPKMLELISDEKLKEIFNPSNIELSLISKSDQNDFLWNHTQKVAFFAYNLAKNNPTIAPDFSPEEFYTLGLLNAIGFYLLNNSSEDQNSYINELSSKFAETKQIYDIFYSGNASPYISMIYAKRLGLSDHYSAIIGNWNNCDYMPDSIKNPAQIIYLAELLQYYNEGTVEFYQFDKEILGKFNITTEEQVQYIIKQMESLMD